MNKAIFDQHQINFSKFSLNLKTASLIIGLIITEIILGKLLLLKMFAPFILLLFVIISGIIIVNNKIGLLLVLFFLPFTYKLTAASLDPIVPFGVILFLSCFIQICVKSDFVLVDHAVDKIMILFVAWIVFSICWTPDRAAGAIVLLRILFGFFLYFVINYILDDEKNLQQAFWTLIVAGIISALLGLVQVIILNADDMYGFSSTSNDFGMFVNISIFMGIGKYLSMGKSTKKNFLFAGILLMIIAVFISDSHGAIIALFFVLTYLFFILAIKKTKWSTRNLMVTGISFFLLLISLIIIFFFLINKETKSGKIGRLSTPSINLDSLVNHRSVLLRLEVWDLSRKMLSTPSNFLIGTGVGGFDHYSKQHSLAKIDAIMRIGSTSDAIRGGLHSHNLYLTIFVTFGIIGFILFLTLLTLTAKSIYLCMKKTEGTALYYLLLGASSALMAYGVHSLVDVGLTNRKFFIILALNIVFLRINKKNEVKACEAAV